MTSSPRLPGMQYARGIAAVMVVICHAALLTEESRYFGSVPFGGVFIGTNAGVEVFFAISGFIVAYISLSAEGQPRLSPAAFLIRRCIRLLPLLWCAVPATWAVLFLLGDAGNPLHYLRAMALLPGVMKPGVVWSLRNEFLFYILFTVAFLGGTRRVWLMCAWGAVMIATVHPSVSSALHHLFWRDVWAIITNPRNLHFLVGLACGVAFVRFRPAVTPPRCIRWLLGALCLAAGTVRLVFSSFPVQTVALAVICLLLVVTAALVREERGGLVHRAGLKLGDASYSIYLVHIMALHPTLWALTPLGNQIAPEAAFLVAVAVAVGWGLAVHHYVEIPLTRHARQAIPTVAAMVVNRRKPVTP